MQLFRQQAIDHQNRLHGEVFLVPPLRWQLVGWLLLFIVFAASLFLAVGSHDRAVLAHGALDGPAVQETTVHSGRSWMATLRVPAARLAGIEPGQPVRIVPRGYPVTEFGALRGVVTAVGSLKIADSNLAVPVTVRLDPPGARQRAGGLVLQAGHPVAARIITGREPLMRLIFAPLAPASGR
jgi:hypothetical protein